LQNMDDSFVEKIYSQSQGFFEGLYKKFFLVFVIALLVASQGQMRMNEHNQMRDTIKQYLDD